MIYFTLLKHLFIWSYFSKSESARPVYFPLLLNILKQAFSYFHNMLCHECVWQGSEYAFATFLWVIKNIAFICRRVNENGFCIKICYRSSCCFLYTSSRFFFNFFLYFLLRYFFLNIWVICTKKECWCYSLLVECSNSFDWLKNF